MPNKTPIFIISGKSPIGASGGGYSTYAYNLARLVKKLGHPTHIVALGDNNDTQKTPVGTLMLVKSSLPFLNINIYALPSLPISSILFAKRIYETFKKNNYKRIIVWGIGPWGLAASILKLILGSKVIHINNYFTTSRHEWWGGVKALKINDYGVWPKLKYLFIYLTVVQYISILEGIVLKSAKYIITNYKSTEEILKEQFNINKSRFKRLHFYVKTYKRNVLKAKSGDEIKLPSKYFLFFSRQDPRKGVNFLLHAMKIVIESEYKIPLLIAGGGDMISANKKLSKKLGIEKYVKFLGFVNDPTPLMKKCSAFIFPSIEEGAGALTVNEAMELGLPIISTACDGIVEDIIDNVSGLLVPMENPQRMAEAMMELIDNTKKAKLLARNAKSSYSKNFSYKRMEKDIKELLKKY